jgi:hypothetical protein
MVGLAFEAAHAVALSLGSERMQEGRASAHGDEHQRAVGMVQAPFSVVRESMSELRCPI